MRSFGSSILTGSSRKTRQAGFSFVELIIAVALLAVVAAAAIPAFSPVSEKTLDIAANEVAAAIRFARSESLRTGVSHGVNFQTFSQRVRVYWLDQSGSFPPLKYEVNHPIDHKLYDFDFDTDPVFSDVTIENAAFYYGNSSLPTQLLGFNRTGTPKSTNLISGEDSLLSSGSITLSYKGRQRLISLESVTGRVTIQ